MSWNLDKSKERITNHLESMGEIEIKKLTRESDLNSLLTETCCREIFGAHIYAQVSNFTSLLSNTSYGDDDYKRMIQGLHIYQRQVSYIIETIFGGLRVHFQGSKVHSLFYRPIDNAETIATKAFLLQIILKDFVKNVFNPAFPNYDNFSISSGADIGTVIGTRNGMKNDRELLFLGAAANYAAKIINTGNRSRLTQNIYDALPEELQLFCDEISTGLYQIQVLKNADFDALISDYVPTWERDVVAERIAQDKIDFPLKDIEYCAAETLIDFDRLGIYNNKRIEAGSVFADVSGFTKYIDEAETEDEKRQALRVFHAIRKELAVVAKRDFNGVRVQYQGDRIQVIFHLPKDEDEKFAQEAVECASGMQSSMEYSLKECLPEAESLTLAIGIDVGTTLVSKLGSRGHRDRICIGEAVEWAARCEEKCSGQQIGITKTVLDLLSEDLQKLFMYDKSAQCYVSTNMTADKIERIKRLKTYQIEAPVFIRSDVLGSQIQNEPQTNSRIVNPSRPYCK